jgi:transcriptional regulator with GAF, ATPase, and Fis domain
MAMKSGKQEDHMDSLKIRVSRIETEEITRALQESNWVMARAARQLGITERMIGYKIRKYGIRKGDSKTAVGMEGMAKGVLTGR